MTELMPGTEEKFKDITTYLRAYASDCDVLLWKPTSWYGQIIARSTDGPFSHATAALKWNGTVMSVGFEEGRGAVVEPLRSVIQRFPGIVSVFRPGNGFNSVEVKAAMLDDLTGTYQWANIRLFVLLHLPLTKIFFPRFVRSRIKAASHRTAGGICSQWVARSFHMQGRGFPLLNKPPAIISPNDLATSPKLQYLYTLNDSARLIGLLA